MRLEDVMSDLAEAAKTGGEVKAATIKLGHDKRKRSEWTLDMALAVAVEAGLPGYADASNVAREPGDDPFAD